MGDPAPGIHCYGSCSNLRGVWGLVLTWRQPGAGTPPSAMTKPLPCVSTAIPGLQGHPCPSDPSASSCWRRSCSCLPGGGSARQGVSTAEGKAPAGCTYLFTGRIGQADKDREEEKGEKRQLASQSETSRGILTSVKSWQLDESV